MVFHNTHSLYLWVGGKGGYVQTRTRKISVVDLLSFFRRRGDFVFLSFKDVF